MLCATKSYAISDGADEITVLDNMLQLKSQYDKKKYSKIRTLIKSLNKPNATSSQKIDALIALGDEYTLFKADSAIVYYTKAMEIANTTSDSSKTDYIKLRKIRPEMIVGFYAEAHDEFRRLTRKNLPEHLLPNYYECGYRIYSFALNSMQKGNQYYDYYYRLTNEFRQKWIKSLPEHDITRRLYEAEQALWDKKYSSARILAEDLLSELPESRNEYAIAAAIMANLMKQQGNKQKSMRYFALSAISDIQCSVKENQSLYELAMMLYDSGDIDRAYRYIFASIEDAAFCNAQVRVYNASRMLPVIEASHREEISRHETVLMTYVFIVSILFIGLSITAFMLIKQMKKLDTARKKLKNANTTKDEYMGQFIELCSVYMKRLDSFTKVVNRKLSLGQVDELIKMTKSARFSEEQHRDFYQAFDIAFLKIYTTFVADINALLRPEEQIKVDMPNSLNTELRIYALLRLGINDSTKIAEFLKYSVNTIYTYRNKMKNKALDRATFEEDVMKIGVIE